MNINPENYRNFFQGITAFIESLIFFNDKWTKDMAFGAIIFVAAFVPSMGWGHGLLTPNNELLLENLVSILLAGVIITPIWNGGILNNMMKAFILQTSSYTVVSEIAYAMITNSAPSYQYIRANNLYPTNVNLATLG